MNEISELKEYLYSLPPGRVPDSGPLLGLLCASWKSLAGSNVTKMAEQKLRRIENPRWQPPCLVFDIERHGETVCGSSRAGVFTWTVDIERKEATCARSGMRQLYAMDKRLDVKPLAETLATAISSRQPHESLKWNTNGSVRLDIGKIIPLTNKETTSGRRTRLRKCLGSLLLPKGWVEKRPNVYAQIND
jgi:hypothetical protein